ncbi:MAG: hypothetical protein QXR27_02730 [Archaeoglobaceae archaeon]
MMGIFLDKRIPIRPDIVVIKGYYERTKDFVDSGKEIDVLIECKEDPFIKWRDEIYSQILLYLHLFKPRLFILASLQPVPSSVKEGLDRQGIKVVDNLRPLSPNIRHLHEITNLSFSAHTESAC